MSGPAPDKGTAAGSPNGSPQAMSAYTPSTAEVKALRDETNAPVMDCRRALEASRGDVEQAKRYLRERGQQMAARKAERVVREGFIGHYIHQGGKLGVLVELGCETDFVAKNEQFQRLAHDIAVHICASRPRYISRDEVPVAERESRVSDDGALERYYEETVLLDQPYVRDESKTVGELIAQAVGVLGENIKVRRFARFDVGES